MSAESTGMSSSAARRRGRLQVLALAIMFVGPAVVAWALALSGWQPSGTTNNGTLVQPPVALQAEGWQQRDGGPLTAGWFRGRWSLMAVVDGACGGACQQLVDRLHEVRLSLAKDMNRARVVVLQPRGTRAPSVDSPDLRRLVAPAGAVGRLVADAPTGGPRMAVYVVDHQGLRMMSYALPLDAPAMLDDLKKLLKTANEDVERMQRLRHERGGGA